jgi:2-iminobutanoate/2-iminopropanoate deaminase
MVRKTFNSEQYCLPVAGFSHAVQADNPGTLLFVSGLLTERRGLVEGKVAWYEEEATVEAEGDIEEQTRRIMESLKNILAEAGATLDDVVRIVIYLVDLDHYPLVHKVRSEYFGDEPPASTCVEVSRLYDSRQLIEIEATAVVPPQA